MDAKILVVDKALARSIDRQLVQVAVGILMQPDGQFLLTSRPEGKAYAGYWEFPGGKIEAGETVNAALARELDEELGIQIRDCFHWQTLLVDYPHALVELQVCKIHAWQGDLQMREGQAMSWQQFPVQISPILPGSLPLLDVLQNEMESQGENQTAYDSPRLDAE